MKPFDVFGLLPGKLRLAVAGCYLLAVLGLNSACSAQAGTSNISLEQALHNTLQGNAELKTYPYHVRVADADLISAKQRPLSTLNLSVENALGSGEFNSFDQSEITLTLGQTIELGNKRQHRVTLANASKQQLAAEYQQKRLSVLVETSRRYYQLLRLQSLQNWLQQRIAVEQQALSLSVKRARAGSSGRADVAKMQLRVSRSEALQSQLSGQAKLARKALAAMWAAQPDFVEVKGELDQLPAVPDRAYLLEIFENAPELVQQQSLQQVAEAQLQLARANRRADLDIGIGVRHLEQSNDQALVLDVSMPLVFSSSNLGAVTKARAARELSAAKQNATRMTLQLSLLTIQQTLVNHHQHANLLKTTLLPQARELLAETETGYRKGSYTILQWVDAQAELFDLQRELIETNTLVYLQLLALESITGESVTGQFTVGQFTTGRSTTEPFAIEPFTSEQAITARPATH